MLLLCTVTFLCCCARRLLSANSAEKPRYAPASHAVCQSYTVHRPGRHYQVSDSHTQTAAAFLRVCRGREASALLKLKHCLLAMLKVRTEVFFASERDTAAAVRRQIVAETVQRSDFSKLTARPAGRCKPRRGSWSHSSVMVVITLSAVKPTVCSAFHLRRPLGRLSKQNELLFIY